MTAGTDLERALSRIAGGPAIAGNRVKLLRDAGENYPAWLEAIASAERVVHFENFIIADDMTGWVFVDALAARARAGVRVRLLYDWLGCCLRASSRLWGALREAGVEVRTFNPPGVTSPLWIRRNHRKVITVDGRLGFVSGLCVADTWRGDREDEPWRDTGVAISGPAVAGLDRAFAETWGAAGAPIEPTEWGETAAAQPAGDMNLRVVGGRPGQLSLYRLDLLIAAAAKRTLWLTDAYFVPSAAYVQALGEAARDGVDVRLLVPGTSDVPGLRPLVQAGYRPLIQAGVRLFEWNGSMLHAKTAVADGRWARVGSTNLNPSSWMTNWELDVVVENEGFAGEMEAMFRRDLADATEIVPGRRIASASRSRRAPRRLAELASAGIGLKGALKAAAGGTRRLDAMEARSVALLGLALLAIAAAVTVFPVLLVSPVVITLAWIAVGLLLRSWRAARALRRRGAQRLAGARPEAGRSARSA